MSSISMLSSTESELSSECSELWSDSQPESKYCSGGSWMELQSSLQSLPECSGLRSDLQSERSGEY